MNPPWTWTCSCGHGCVYNLQQRGLIEAFALAHVAEVHADESAHVRVHTVAQSRRFVHPRNGSVDA